MMLFLTRWKWMPVMQQLPIEGLPYAYQSLLPLFEANEAEFNPALVQQVIAVLTETAHRVWSKHGYHGRLTTDPGSHQCKWVLGQLVWLGGRWDGRGRGPGVVAGRRWGWWKLVCS